MSAYQEYETEFTDVNLLVDALVGMTTASGTVVTRDMIEVHTEPQALYGYRGDRRPQQAEVIIRRQHVNSAANDMGWARAEDGKLRALVSEYDRTFHGEAWHGEVAQRYAVKHVEKKAKALGYSVSQETVDGKVKMKLKRFR